MSLVCTSQPLHSNLKCLALCGAPPISKNHGEPTSIIVNLVLNPLKKVEVSLSHAMEGIQTTKSEIEAQGDSVANEIKSSFA